MECNSSFGAKFGFKIELILQSKLSTLENIYYNWKPYIVDSSVVVVFVAAIINLRIFVISSLALKINMHKKASFAICACVVL